MRLCEKCKTNPVDGGRAARFCKACRYENQAANGRRGGKKNAAAGHGRIHVESQHERFERLQEDPWR